MKKETKFAIKPLGDRVVVRPEAPKGEQRLPSGILLPSGEKERPMTGTVVAVGPGKYEDGKVVPITVKKGDKILFGKYSHEEVKIAGEEYYLVSESNILAILN
jgi:chaperonin GroES